MVLQSADLQQLLWPLRFDGEWTILTEQEPIKQIISNGNLAISSTINPRYLNTIDRFTKEVENANKAQFR